MTKQEVALHDARTFHAEIRAADHSVEIRKPRIIDFKGATISVVDETRETAGAAAIYVSDDKRPDYAQVGVRMQTSGYFRGLFFLLYVLIVLAGWGVSLLPDGSSLDTSLVLLALPITFASAFLLTREPTSLAQRLVRPYQAFLGLLVAALWAYMVFRMVDNAICQPCRVLSA